ncbi:hypothetical protein BJX70DRAFT_343209 [Aspergillus crustosus]
MTAPHPFPYVPNTLYLLLLDRGDTATFHWALYLSPANTNTNNINGDNDENLNLTTNNNTSAPAGTIHHLVDTPTSTTCTPTPTPAPKTWTYITAVDTDPSPNNLSRSDGLFLAHPLSPVDPSLIPALTQRLSEIPIAYSKRFREEINCVVWVYEALILLEEEGFVDLGLGAESGDGDEEWANAVRGVGERATMAAMVNQVHGRRGVGAGVVVGSELG